MSPLVSTETRRLVVLSTIGVDLRTFCLRARPPGGRAAGPRDLRTPGAPRRGRQALSRSRAQAWVRGPAAAQAPTRAGRLTRAWLPAAPRSSLTARTAACDPGCRALCGRVAPLREPASALTATVRPRTWFDFPALRSAMEAARPVDVLGRPEPPVPLTQPHPTRDPPPDAPMPRARQPNGKLRGTQPGSATALTKRLSLWAAGPRPALARLHSPTAPMST